MRFDDQKELIGLARTLKGLAEDDVHGARNHPVAEKVIAACALAWALGELLGEMEFQLPGSTEAISRYTNGCHEGGKQAGYWGLPDEETASVLGTVTAQG